MKKIIIIAIAAIITAFLIRALVIQYVYMIGNKPPAYLTENFIYPDEYSNEEIALAMKYHGIHHCSGNTITGDWWFYRNGEKCNLFTSGAKEYVRKNTKGENYGVSK